jgi:hypothetical protein
MQNRRLTNICGHIVPSIPSSSSNINIQSVHGTVATEHLKSVKSRSKDFNNRVVSAQESSASTSILNSN